ncbi:peptidase A24 [Bifidobacterium sp.]|jgi:leader peptidase (prepilin peptidase)/N-methyltransferase|uniref:peptidase A24 n=1 Tax=Bifidobacterium sp. TaxID=41200 RepID=UPI0025B97393|nr:peptidase A24 [Bifidobacterium sp.]MCH4208606.1 peptidase A24 [Bifidobacterium sp.]MCI1224292.1 peptidase A24 [Bifidobacterium sp.]
MPYFCLLPSLICGCLLILEDIRSRRVPRAWVGAGMLAQCAALVVYGVSSGRPWGFLIALGYSLLAGVMQWALSHLRTGSLGFGDVTSVAMTAQAVGWFGFGVFVQWWLIMGVGGLVWIICWSGFARLRKTTQGFSDAGLRPVPFVPVIVISGIVAIAIG